MSSPGRLRSSTKFSVLTGYVACPAADSLRHNHYQMHIARAFAPPTSCYDLPNECQSHESVHHQTVLERSCRSIAARRCRPQTRSDCETSAAARHRRCDRSGHFRAHRPGRCESCRARNHAQLCSGRHCSRLRGTLLCRVRRDAASCGQRLLVRVCDSRRIHRLADRLDAGARIPARRRLDRCGVVRML